MLKDSIGNPLQDGDLVAFGSASGEVFCGRIVQSNSGLIAKGLSIQGNQAQGQQQLPYVMVQVMFTKAFIDQTGQGNIPVVKVMVPPEEKPALV